MQYLNKWASNYTLYTDKLFQTSYLKVWLCEASCHSNHGGGEWAGDADGGQELWDVWRQAERNRTISVQVARGIVDVEAEVGDIQFSCVLQNKRTE